MTEGKLPLEGLRVLDLSRYLPGPYATLLLADLGAHVDKLEEPSGDPVRQMPPKLGEDGALFFGLNRNKRSFTLNLKTAEGVAALLKLVPSYDIVVESFRPGVMEKLGLSYARLSNANPRLIYCAISGYGQDGPDRLKAGHDLNYVARAGVLGYGGDPSGLPSMPGVQMGDISGGLFGVIGILAAVLERQTTGKGRLVDISMTETATAFLHMHLAARLALGGSGSPLQRGVEELNGGLPSYNLYRTKDGRALAVAALEPKFMAALAERLGHPQWVSPAYGSDAERAKVKAEMAAVFQTKTLAEWKTALAGLDACVEPVAEGDDVLADAQLNARGLFVEGKDGRKHMLTPLRFGPPRLEAPPKLGQHTDEILK